MRLPAFGRPPATITAALLLAACDGPQSALDPRGEAAESIRILTDYMFAASVAVTLLVTLLVWGAFRKRKQHKPSARLLIFGGGFLLPVIVISALVLYSATSGESMHRATPGAERVTVSGYQYWWEFTYERPPRSETARPPQPETVVTANELWIPAGRPTEIHLKSPDVIHSFWVPSLAGKIDLIPGRTNRIVLAPTKTGIFRGQCAEFCGEQHAAMAFDVVVASQKIYERWLARQSEPANAPETPFLQQGQRVFIEQGCGACHAIRGIDGAPGELGPDLTHFGSRQSIAAGLLPNTPGNIAAWIASSQHLKPGNKMPSFDRLSGEELRAVTAYLESLK